MTSRLVRLKWESIGLCKSSTTSARGYSEANLLSIGLAKKKILGTSRTSFLSSMIVNGTALSFDHSLSKFRNKSKWLDRALSIRSQILAWISGNFQWRMEQPFGGFSENRLTLQGTSKFSKIYFREFREFLAKWKRPNFQEIYELLNFWNMIHLTKFPSILGAAEISWEKFSNIWVNSARQASVLGGIWKSRKDFPIYHSNWAICHLQSPESQRTFLDR